MNSADAGSSRKRLYQYQVAGREVIFDRSLPELSPFFQKQLISTDYSQNAPGDFLSEAPPIIQVEGSLFDQMLQVAIYSGNHDYRIEVLGRGSFDVTADGRFIRQRNCVSEIDSLLQDEILLGPPLIFALALQGVWCLHASAVTINKKVVAFIGDSGAGKSTLAAYLSQARDFQYTSDDILPISHGDKALVALPNFPQLKLASSEQPCLQLPKAVQLSTIYILEEQPSISINEMNKVSSFLALISNTVAAQLFDQKLLSDHFIFCHQAISNISVRTLAYPRKYEFLPLVLKEIEKDISTISR